MWNLHSLMTSTNSSLHGCVQNGNMRSWEVGTQRLQLAEVWQEMPPESYRWNILTDGQCFFSDILVGQVATSFFRIGSFPRNTSAWVGQVATFGAADEFYNLIAANLPLSTDVHHSPLRLIVVTAVRLSSGWTSVKLYLSQVFPCIDPFCSSGAAWYAAKGSFVQCSSGSAGSKIWIIDLRL